MIPKGFQRGEDMLKPMKTVRLKTVGLGVRFARGITERAAVFGGYELSETELVFAMGAVRERDDLISALELLDKVLDLVRRGFDRRAHALSVRLINNIGIILSRGGFSRQYFETLKLFDRLSAVISSKTEEFSLSQYRSEIRTALASLRSETLYRAQSASGTHTFGAFSKLNENPRKTFSEREILTLNTLNSGIFRIISRNPELLKMLKTDKLFTELSLKNIEKLRRRTDRALAAERFLDSLTDRQLAFLENFISEHDLFSELRESASPEIDLKYDLRYLVRNSSEKSLAEFFETLKQAADDAVKSRGGADYSETREQSKQTEKAYFKSAREMWEFFASANTSEIKSFISLLSRDSSYHNETEVLNEALEMYQKNRKMSGEFAGSDENLTETAEFSRLFEIAKTAETALEHRLAEESFSAREFFRFAENSRELKRLFADYAWENYRSEAIMSRFADYLSLNSRGITNTADNSPEASRNSENSRIIAGSQASKISEISEVSESEKSSFADFLINSNGLNLRFSENLKNSFINSSSDVAAAFAEYLVNAVREGELNDISPALLALAEKTEKALYYGGNGDIIYDIGNIESKSSEIRTLIREAWNKCGSELAELYSGFTRQGGVSGFVLREIASFYSYIPKSNFTALSEFFEAAALGDEYFTELSERFKTELAAARESDIAAQSGVGEYTFLDALTELSDSELTLLYPLVGAVEIENSESPENAALFERVTAEFGHFSEYLSSVIRAREFTGSQITAADYSSEEFERLSSLSERLETVFSDELRNTREVRSSEALNLIYREWKQNPGLVSRLYSEFEREQALEYRESTRTAESSLSLRESDIQKLFERLESAGSAHSYVHSSRPERLVADYSESLKHSERIADSSRTILLSLSAAMPRFPEPAGGSASTVYNITTAENGILSPKSIVINRKLHNAVKAFSAAFGDTENRYGFYESPRTFALIQSLGQSLELSNYASANSQNDRFFTWESENTAFFTREILAKAHSRTVRFPEGRSTAALAFSEMISEKSAVETRFSEYNKPAELFYTDEYFDNSQSGTSGVSVNYALPSAADPYNGQDNVSEALQALNEKIDTIGGELTQIRQREEETSREFVTKSEQKIFERELKSSIERDIYLAGKRHGIK